MKRIERVDFSGNPDEINSDLDHWLELKEESRQSVVQELEKFHVDDRIIAQVKEPEASDKISIYSKTFVLNLAVSLSDEDFSKDFLTILLKPGLLITILNHQNELFQNIVEEINNNPYEVNIDILNTIYYMFTQILHRSTANIKNAREMVDSLSKQIDEDHDDLELDDILKAKHKVNQLANIIEDQHITLGLIPKLNWSIDVNRVEKEINKITERFKFLHYSVNKLEERIRDLQLHYQMILQEKGNKRLNTLTVVQAIFVPLTLISGIYGMNFVVMPELQWNNGYYIILCVMLTIALVELWIFKKNGWFD